MSIGRAILRGIFSRTTAGLLGLLGLGLIIWFGGPYLGVGASHPLEDASTRIVLLILILSFLLFWLLHWPVSVVAVAALCLFLWYGGPLLTIGGVAPLEPEWLRILVISLLAAAFGLYMLYRLWQAVRANDDLLQKILHPRPGTPESPAKEQLLEVRSILQKALRHLRGVGAEPAEQGFRCRLGRLFQGSRYIYELPWYMILGAPGIGKTTAIAHSGLRFPLAEQAGGLPLAGVEGTRNCAWWFSNEAVLIDTAGRYTTHESNAVVDEAEWKGFLALLRKHRPRAPINGALLALSAEDLLGKSAAELARQAAPLRERLLELQRELGIRFPIYVLVTKMDLLKGFSEYFHDLNSDGRDQVWGFTLPYVRKQTQSIDDIMRLAEGELDLLTRRLEQGLNTRLREEYDTEKRRALYCFPGEFDALREPLLRMLELVFFESRYNSAKIQNIMRGVYFTSAVQTPRAATPENTTLMQRIMDMAQGMTQGMGGYGGDPRTAPPVLSDSRSYFLRDALRGVIFPEAFLVQPNLRWELRFRTIRGLGHLLLLLLAVALGGALLGSKERNMLLLEDLRNKTAQLEKSLDAVSADSGGELLPYALHQACTLTKYPDFDPASPPLAWRAGLYAAGPAAESADALCRALQRRFLLPPVQARLVRHLSEKLAKTAAPKASHAELYEALRLYLSLHDEENYDADALLAWFINDIKTSPADSFFAKHDLLPEYLERLLLGAPEGFGSALTPDTALVNRARAVLRGDTREERLYALAKAHLRAAAAEDFIPARHVGEQGTQVLYRISGHALSEAIPGLFTRAGYLEIFSPGLTTFLLPALRQDAWIMGDAENENQGKRGFRPLSSQQMSRKIRRLYLEEYAATWKRFVEDIHALPGSTPESVIANLNILGGTSSPLEQLALAVARETALTGKEKDAAAQVLDAAVKKAKAKTRTTDLEFGTLDAVNLVDRHFAALRKVVTGSVAPDAALRPPAAATTECNAVRGLLAEYAAHMADIAKAESSQALPPASDIAQRMQSKAAQLPPFFSTVLRDLAQHGADQESRTRGRTLAQMAEKQVGVPCRRYVERRYPLTADAHDADSVEFSRIFAPGGLFDAFFQTHLAPLVDTEARPWQYREPTPGAPDLTGFERAAAIRDALFRGGDAKTWSLELQLSVVDMDPRIERMDLSIGKETLQYEHGPSKPMAVIWDGASAKATAELAVRPRNLGIAPLKASGPWALLHLLQQGTVEQTETPGNFLLTFDLDGYAITLEMTASADNPLTSDVFSGFSCPRDMP